MSWNRDWNITQKEQVLQQHRLAYHLKKFAPCKLTWYSRKLICKNYTSFTWLLMCSKDYIQNESKKSKIQYFSQEAVKNTYWAIRPTVAITSLSEMVARYSKWPCQKAHLLYSRKRKHINGEKIKLTFFQSATWSIFFQSADWTTLIAIRCCCMLSFLNPLLELLG